MVGIRFVTSAQSVRTHGYKRFFFIMNMDDDESEYTLAFVCRSPPPIRRGLEGPKHDTNNVNFDVGGGFKEGRNGNNTLDLEQEKKILDEISNICIDHQINSSSEFNISELRVGVDPELGLGLGNAPSHHQSIEKAKTHLELQSESKASTSSRTIISFNDKYSVMDNDLPHPTSNSEGGGQVCHSSSSSTGIRCWKRGSILGSSINSQSSTPLRSCMIKKKKPGIKISKSNLKQIVTKENG